AHLDQTPFEVRSALGYRLLSRLRRWRRRLLFLSATHMLRPTFKDLMEAVFCWPWRAVLPRSVVAILDGRNSDPDFYHHGLKVFSPQPEPWQKRKFQTVETGTPSPRTIRVSLIATVLNEAENVERWVKSIARQSRPPDELIVVDGGSSDETVEGLLRESQGLPFEVRILRQPGSNIAQGRNVALRQAGHPFVAVTDAGCELTPRWLEQLVAPFELDEKVDGVIGWCQIHPDSSWGQRHSWLLLPALEATDPKRLLPSSRSFAFRKALGLRLGGYPEHLTKWGEDTLFCLNLTGLGTRWAFAPEAVTLWHGPCSWREALRLRRNYQLGNGEARVYLSSMGGSAREVLTLGPLAISAMIFAGAAAFLPVLLLVSGAFALLSLFYLKGAGLTRWAIERRRRCQRGGRGALSPILQAWAMGVADTVGSIHGLWRSRGAIVRRALDPRADTLVFLQSHEWFWMKQRVGHLAESFAARGLQVVFLPQNIVEQTFGGLLPVPGGIVLCNDAASLRCLRRPVVYSAAAHHFSSGRTSFLGRARRILDMADLPEVGGSTAKDLAATGSADLVYAASETLAHFYQAQTGRPAALLRNGVCYEHWQPLPRETPSDLRPILGAGKKIVGYTGALGWWVDFALLEAAARSRPEWQFVLIGPICCDETAPVIGDLPENVLDLGVKAHAELPAYVETFSAGIIPFVVGSETRASNPIKLYEYAAMELPIVSTDLPECRDTGLVHIARSPEEFVECLDQAMLEREDPEARRVLREFAVQNTWEQRAQVILADLGLADLYPHTAE
ncbi:MAG: glycosyltransferase, partial [Pseudomonadota bacterium]|nr:glycosyltransferase [Pseudomonadota bacterium]